MNDSRSVELEGTGTTGNVNDTITLNDGHILQLIIESGATFDDTTVSGANHALYINGDSTVGVDDLGTYTKSGDGTTDVTVPSSTAAARSTLRPARSIWRTAAPIPGNLRRRRHDRVQRLADTR